MSASSAPGLTRIVVVMVIAQIVNATFGNAASVYAPVVAPELGVPAQAVGVYLAVLFGTGLVTGLLFVGAVRRYGAVRIMQTVALCHAIGFALPAAGSAVAALVGAFVMGASAGVALPASAHIIARVTPREQLGLVFSLKQTGAPIAIGLVGILIPAMLLVMHWRASMLVLSLAGLAMVALLEPLRAALDDDRVPSTPLRGASLLAPIRLVAAHPQLRLMAWTTLALSAAQLAMLGYLVSYLNLELGYSLVAAGLILTISQASTVFARLAWGWLADRLANPLRVLAIISIGSGVTGAALAALRPEWGFAAAVVVVMGYSAFAMGWNGVFLAGVAQNAPRGEVPAAMIGVQLFSFIGMLGGPLLFAAIVSLAGRYAPGFLAFALSSLASGIWTLRRSAALHAATARAAGA